MSKFFCNLINIGEKCERRREVQWAEWKMKTIIYNLCKEDFPSWNFSFCLHCFLGFSLPREKERKQRLIFIVCFSCVWLSWVTNFQLFFFAPAVAAFTMTVWLSPCQRYFSALPQREKKMLRRHTQHCLWALHLFTHSLEKREAQRIALTNERKMTNNKYSHNLISNFSLCVHINTMLINNMYVGCDIMCTEVRAIEYVLCELCRWNGALCVCSRNEMVARPQQQQQQQLHIFDVRWGMKSETETWNESTTRAWITRERARLLKPIYSISHNKLKNMRQQQQQLETQYQPCMHTVPIPLVCLFQKSIISSREWMLCCALFWWCRARKVDRELDLAPLLTFELSLLL